MSKDNLKVVICVGCVASGKSFWSKQFIKNNPSWVRVNRDHFRLMLKDAQVCEPKIEELITTLQDTVINQALNKRLNVIVDNTNLKPKYIQHIVDLVRDKADVEFKIFDISLEIAIERDTQREAKVGEKVVRSMFKDFKSIIDSEYNFVNIKKSYRAYKEPVRDPNLQDIVIFDIDGTLAHMNGKRGPFEWYNVHLDDLDQIVAQHARDCHKLGYKIFIMSGRDSVCRDLTQQWLNHHNIPNDCLLMRAQGDMRKDNIIKRELYTEHIAGKFNVRIVFDDRDQVTKEWRSMGLKVFQVNPGDF